MGGGGHLDGCNIPERKKKELHEPNYIKMIKPNVPLQFDEGRWVFNRASYI